MVVILTVSSYALGNVYHRVSNDNMQIALTFDDGPHPGRTPEILDILEKYNIKATFFVVGQNVENYPEVFKRAVAEGHEIGNHTFSHRTLGSCSEDAITEEMEQFNKTIAEYGKTPTANLRPPGGIYGDTLREFAESNGYNIVLWSVDTLDWAHKDVDNIVNNVLSNTDGGDIILMHDYISGKSPTPEALEIIIPQLLDRGFEFVTVSELIKA